MNQAEYDERMRRLKEDTESARRELNRVRAVYDKLCDAQRDLRIEWQAEKRRIVGGR